jgi:hypothetical protein
MDVVSVAKLPARCFAVMSMYGGTSSPGSAYVKEVALGTEAMIHEPSNVESTPLTVTGSPAMRPWAVEVVSVATPADRILFVMPVVDTWGVPAQAADDPT